MGRDICWWSQGDQWEKVQQQQQKYQQQQPAQELLLLLPEKRCLGAEGVP